MKGPTPQIWYESILHNLAWVWTLVCHSKDFECSVFHIVRATMQGTFVARDHLGREPHVDMLWFKIIHIFICFCRYGMFTMFHLERKSFSYFRPLCSRLPWSMQIAMLLLDTGFGSSLLMPEHWKFMKTQTWCKRFAAWTNLVVTISRLWQRLLVQNGIWVLGWRPPSHLLCLSDFSSVSSLHMFAILQSVTVIQSTNFHVRLYASDCQIRR